MVKINELKILGFGRFSNHTLKLHQGLNIIYGGNEAGKTTLHRFIEAMLFGFWQVHPHGVVREEYWEKYQPWKKGLYAGELQYAWDGGNVLLQRDFATDSLIVTDAESGELLPGFEANSLGEPDYARKHFGLSKLMYRNTVSISQLGAATDIEALTEIREMLRNLARSGGSGISLQQGVMRLEAVRNDLGAEDSVGKPLANAKERCLQLSARVEDAKAQIRQARGLEIELIAVEGELDSLQTERQNLHSAHNRLQGQAAARKLELLESLQNRKTQLEDQLAQLPQRPLPSEVSQGHIQLMGEIVKAKESLALNQQKLEELQKRYSEQQSRLDGLAVYQKFGQDTLIEMSSAWQLLAKGLQVIAELRQQQQLLSDEIRETSTALSQLPYFRSDVLEHAATLQKQAEGGVLLDSREDLTRELDNSENKFTLFRWGRGLSLAIIPLAGFLAWFFNLWPLTLAAVPALVLFFLLASGQQRLNQRCRNLRRKIYAVELEFQNSVRQRELAQREFAALLAKAGAEKYDELTEKFQLFVSLGEKNRELHREFKFLSGKLESYDQEMLEKDKELQEILREVGLSDLPIEEALRRFRINLDSYLEIQGAVMQTRDHLDTAVAADREGQGKLQWFEQQLSNLYKESGVADGPELEALSAAQAERAKLSAQLLETEQRCQDLLEGEDLSQLQRLAVIAGAEEPAEDDLPQRILELDQAILQLQTRRGEISPRLDWIYDKMEPLADIEEELEQAESCLNLLKNRRQALDLALAKLEDIAASLSRQLAPDLNQRVSQIVKRITGDRYRDLDIDSDMNINVTTAQNPDPVSLDSLSGGTIDQIYFASRVAIADLVAGSSRLPLFLDDSFIQYDDERLARMLELLMEMAEERQILMFTCQKREHQLLSRFASDRYSFINLDIHGG